MKSRVYFLLFFAFISHLSNAQYQMASNPLRVNTSLAGARSAPRFAGNFLQNINGSYLEYKRDLSYFNLSYDNFIKPIKSGIGIYGKYGSMRNTSAGDFYSLSNTSMGVCIAPKFSNGKHFPTITLSPSLGLEWTNYHMKFGAPGFESMTRSKNLMTVRAGILFNNNYSFLGLGFKYLSSNSHHYLFSSFHAGYTFRGNVNSRFSFSPTVSIQFVEAFGVVDPEAPSENYLYIDALNLNFRYNKLIVGTGIPTIMIGYQSNKIRASISYNTMLIRVNNFFDGQSSANSAVFSILYNGLSKK